MDGIGGLNEYLRGLTKQSRKRGKNKEQKIRCSSCNGEFAHNKIIHGPNPFAEEIHNDLTEVDLCKGCYAEFVRDI